MSQKMDALVFDRSEHNWDNSEGWWKENIEAPCLDEALSPGDAHSVILKMKFAGVCGSDKGIWFRKSFKNLILGSLQKENRVKRIMGHELLGEIVEVGSAVSREYGYKPGDVMAAESHIICGTCYQCRVGETHICANEKILGISHDGCFAQYIKIPAKVLWPTDLNKIRPEVACIQEPFGNAVHACQSVDMRGKTVAVFGTGTIGMFCILIARALGAAKIFGVEPNEFNRHKAELLGVDGVVAVNPKPELGPKADPEVVAQLKHLTDEVGVDVALEMSGFNSSLNNALQSVRRGGKVILFGLESKDWVIEGMDRVIVSGVSMHSIIGRQIFQTWYMTRGLLENQSNGIQDKIYDVILDKGDDTILRLKSFDREDFKNRLKKHPKLVLQM